VPAYNDTVSQLLARNGMKFTKGVRQQHSMKCHLLSVLLLLCASVFTYAQKSSSHVYPLTILPKPIPATSTMKGWNIGNLEYANLYTDPATGYTYRAYILSLDTTKVTAQTMSFNDAILTLNGYSEHTGAFQCLLDGVNQCGWLFLASNAPGYILSSCSTGCTSVTVQLVALNDAATRWIGLNGSTFIEWAIDSWTESPVPGQPFLKDYQHMQIVLHPDPKGK